MELAGCTARLRCVGAISVGPDGRVRERRAWEALSLRGGSENGRVPRETLLWQALLQEEA